MARRRREREERRRQREEEAKREEEEMERRREERRREREERRRQMDLELGGTTTTTSSETSSSSSSSNTAKQEEEERKAREEKQRKEQEEKEREEREARRQREREEREKEEKEAEARKAKEEKEREDRRRQEREEREREREQKEREEKDREERRQREKEDREREEKRQREKEDREREEKRQRDREDREREEKRQREKEEQEREERRQRERDEKEREEKKQKEREAQDDDWRRQKKDDGKMAEVRAENERLESANRSLEKQVASLKRELEDVSSLKDKVSSLEKENASLKAEIERLRSAAASSSASSAKTVIEEETSSAPRLTSATKNRPTRTKPGRGLVSKDSEKSEPAAVADEPEEEVKIAPEKVLGKSASTAMDMLAATLRGNAGKKPASSGNVFVSAGTKGGEISRSLFMLKGKTRIRAVRVEDSPKSITQNDVFILETKTHIWTYIGNSANRLKIARAVDVVGKMQRQRGQARAATLETVEKKNEHDPSSDRKRNQFWGEFEAGEPANIPEGEDDTEWELNYEAKTNLFLINPGFELVPMAQGKLKQEDLEGDKVYLLDSPYEMYVWCGKSSDMNHRKESVEKAQEMLATAKADGLKAAWVEVERVAEKGESALFEDKFFKWSDSMRHVIGKVQHKALSNVAVSDKKQELPRILLMHEGELEPPQEYTDDLDGTPEIILVKDFRRSPLPASEHGTFYSKHCYIILYRYSDTGIFYYWLGRDAGVTEMGTAASLAKEWAGECGLNRPNLVRVDQGKENRHFLQLFKGRMLVYMGERGSETQRTKSMFHLRGTEAANTRSFECPDVSGVYLNSDDVFILNTKENQYMWVGEYANSSLRTIASDVAEKVRGNRSSCKKVEEGSEPETFKESIGWKSEYAKHEKRVNDLPVKLFICTNANKQYRADRCAEFVQTDLCHENQAILDRYTEVIVWIGRTTKPEDRQIVMEVAVDYVDKARDGRTNCNVWVMEEGEENVDFTRYFQAWDPYRQKSTKKHIVQGPPLLRRDSSLAKAQELLKGSQAGTKYPLKVLLDRDYLPAGVDKKCLENFLRDEDFPEVFGMTSKEFFALPAWKRLEKKKTSPLF